MAFNAGRENDPAFCGKAIVRRALNVLRHFPSAPADLSFSFKWLQALMSFQLLPALCLFAFVSSITPGPNNIMLMTSGMNFGFKRTIPHMLGIGVGFVVMVVLVGLGVAQVMDRYPQSHTILKVACTLYMFYLAWKIAIAAAPEDVDQEARPMTFLEAALFQWVNPKAWAMALTSISLYAPDKTFLSIMIVAIVFGLINLPSVGVWTIIGQQIRKILQEKKHRRLFNLIMASLLILSLYPMLFP